ncbi:hypothetical protein HYU21_00330 [Candidatus Woesearchaeota archaeon]|nr:hypothetical protein [Candidatus Woesearchaeota archaeon]
MLEHNFLDNSDINKYYFNRSYLNKSYLNKDNLLKIRYQLKINKSIILFSILDDHFLKLFQREIDQLEYNPDFKLSFYSCKKARPNQLITTTCKSILKNYFKKEIKTINLYRFGWKDYTILNDKLKSPKCLEAIFIFSKEKWNEDDGGNIVYVDAKGRETVVPITNNSLIIKQKENGEKRYLKYINSGAKHKTIFLIECL